MCLELSGILFLISIIFVFKTVVVAKRLISGILFVTFPFFSKYCLSVL